MQNMKFSDFEKFEIRTGTIITVEDFERAIQPAYKIWVDFGEEFGVLQTSARLTVNYTKFQLINKQIIGVLNLGEKNIAGFKSQFLLLGFPDDNKDIVLAIPIKHVKNGQKIC